MAGLVRPSHSGFSTTRARRGYALIYLSIAFVILCAFVSLAVDIGRVQVAKTELQAGADSAALYGAAGLSESVSVSGILSRCETAAGENNAAGTPITLVQAEDIEMGTWNDTTGEFVIRTGADRVNSNAVRVATRRTQTPSSGLP